MILCQIQGLGAKFFGRYGEHWSAQQAVGLRLQPCSSLWSMVVYSFFRLKKRVYTMFCCCRLVVIVSVSNENTKLPAKMDNLDHARRWCQVLWTHVPLMQLASQHAHMS